MNVIRKVKRGVQFLGDILSGGVCMHDIHTISLYALLGTSTFAVMLKNLFKLELDGDFLVGLKRRVDRENYRKNEND
jgi:hypothetical protein